ncbi:YncE family protein [Vineibacter terrae]|uniref:YncE family protein n=1 Tax=Vineibacter terrae TaxID=2586908 RepID=UPI001C49A9E5|nr:WD40 repeat domain-containing protein [Vineibacter terrae]
MVFRSGGLAFLFGALLAISFGRMTVAEPNPSLVLERTIPLKGVSGRIDHLAVDLGRSRLFVAELGNNTVDVIDLASGQALHRIADLKEPQGVAYTKQGDVLAVANAGDGSVRLFRADDFSAVGTVALGDDADNIRVEPRRGHLIVGYGRGGLAILDSTSRSLVGTISLEAHPEGFQIDPRTQRVLVNVPDARQIAVVDLEARKQIATWKVPAARANFPMAIDGDAARLATVFRNPARLILLDTGTGGVVSSLPTCADSDDVFFDAKRRRIYVSCGEGAVDVFQGSAAGYQAADRIKTSSGARTSLFVPELDRLFVAVRAGLLGSDASILVFRPAP